MGQYKVCLEAAKMQTAGLESVHGMLESVAHGLAVLVTYNKEVHAAVYDSIIRDILDADHN